MALTPKQEKFCQKYVLTGNASEAYRQAYNAGNMSAKVIANKACELLKNNPISIRIKQLQEETKKEFIISAEMKREMLWNIAHNCSTLDDETKKVNNAYGAVSAISELNKMDGDLASQKVDMTVNRPKVTVNRLGKKNK